MSAVPRGTPGLPAGYERAAQVFAVDEHATDSAFVEKVWSTHSAPRDAFLSVADVNWQLVVTRHREETSLVIQGPNDRARVTPLPADAEFFGIVLPVGAFPPGIPLAGLVGRAELLPDAGARKVWLGGSRWEIPTAENADVFVERLVKEGIVVRDRYVARGLEHEDDVVSPRSMQRRVRRATGMTHAVIRQIARAHDAVDALGRGVPPSVVAAALGYSDQPHLTRSLTRFIGQTPAQALNTGGHWSASSRVPEGVPARS